MLLIPDNTKPFRVETDASNFAIGAILSRPNQQNKWQPVTFNSKSLSPAKRNYEVYDKEMLAVMHAFDKWSHYLRGAQEQIEVLMDHQKLTYFRKPQNLNRRQAHWVLDLQEYNFVIKHRSGKSNSKVDILSWQADHITEEKDNENIILLKDHLFIHQLNINIYDTDDYYNDIIKRLEKINKKYWDEEVEEELKDKNNKNEWTIVDKLVRKDGRIYIPNIRILREEIINLYHSWEHPGIDKTTELLQRDVYWKTLEKDVKTSSKGVLHVKLTNPTEEGKATNYTQTKSQTNPGK